MARFRAFDPETANQLIPRITTSDTVDLINSGEYFSADAGDVILAPSVKNGDVLYIRIRTAGRPEPATVVEPPAPAVPAPEPEPVSTQVKPEPTSAPPTASSATKSKHYVASGFLGLDGEVEEETPEPPKPWWKRLID